MTDKTDLVDSLDLYERTIRLLRSGGMPRGQSTGWPKLDEFFTVAEGQLTIVTGVPGSGKSAWLDALMVNLAEGGDWLFAVYSPENWPEESHVAKLLDKRMRKPHRAGPNPTQTLDEHAEGVAWILDRFMWLDTELKTPDYLIQRAFDYGKRGHKLGVVLDPWNALDHERYGMSETDYISYTLAKVTHLIRQRNAHVFLVVHPTKIPRDKDGTRGVPSPYDIAGSAHWYNKADNIITIHRQKTPETQEVEVHVQKIRSSNIGRIGLASLLFDKVTGRYFEDDGPLIEGEWLVDPQRGQEPPKRTRADNVVPLVQRTE